MLSLIHLVWQVGARGDKLKTPHVGSYGFYGFPSARCTGHEPITAC